MAKENKSARDLDLVGKSLERFKLEELTEVYHVDTDGRKYVSLGYFRSEDVAKAFAGYQTDAAYHKTQKVLVVTNGQYGFVLGEPIALLDDEEATLKIRAAALAKLSEPERKVLGLG